MAVNRWKPRVQEAIRDVTRLKLRDDRFSSRRGAVPIQIKPGFPSSLDELANKEISEDQRLIELIGTYKTQLESLKAVAKPFEALATELANLESFVSESAALRQMIEAVRTTDQELRKYIGRAGLGNVLQLVENDILGAYHFREHNDLFRSDVTGTKIELYWLIIGAVSRLIGIDVERLTVLVMAHELGHAYSHVGCDASGNIWSQGFSYAEMGVTEGIAQYYTWAVAKRLDGHHYSKFLEAYEAKINCQSGPYLVHIPWTKEYSLEVFRQALVEARNIDDTVGLSLFQDLLAQSKSRIC